MADDKHSDSVDESDASHTLPDGAELADEDLATGGADAVGPDVTEGGAADDAELSETAPIVDDEAGDGYVDDPDTPDVNEAKLDRATDEVADEPTVDPGSTAQRRPRSSRPVRRRPAGDAAAAERPADVAATTDDEADEVASDPDEAAELEPTPATDRRRTVAKKDRPTPGRSSRREETTTRTGPVKFVNESVGELRKVVWPTANQVQQYFVVVLVFVLFIIAFVSLLDLGLGWALLKVFG